MVYPGKNSNLEIDFFIMRLTQCHFPEWQKFAVKKFQKSNEKMVFRTVFDFGSFRV